MASQATNADWLALTVEAPLEPDLPICDPHHHLWDFRPTRVAPRYLLDEIRLRGESRELKDEVTELARKYSIVTPYTAYLIQEDETRRGIAQNARTMSIDRFGVDKRDADAFFHDPGRRS